MAGADETPRDSWSRMARYYDRFSKKSCGFLAPLRAAVERIEASEWSGRFWASQSHFALVVSPFARWADRLAGPRILVPDGSTTSVRRYTAAGESVGIAECPAAECLPLLEAGLAWLAVFLSEFNVSLAASAGELSRSAT